MKKNFISFLFLATLSSSIAQVKYPESKKLDHVDQYFGHLVEDPYQWLENDNAEDTKSWVTEQNQVTQNYLKKIPYRNAIKERLTILNNYEKYYNFIKAGSLVIYEKNDGLKNQAVWMYKDGLNGEEKILLDPNSVDPKGTTTFKIIGFSKEKNLLTFGINKAGSDWMSIKIFDLSTFQFLEDELKWIKFSNAEWYKNGFYYSKYPTPEIGKELSASSEFQSIYYHELGTPQSEDVLIYQDLENPRHYHSVSNTNDLKYQILYKSCGTDGYETLYRELTDDPKESTDFKYLFKGFNNKNTIIGNIEKDFYVMTDIDAPNYRLVKINIDQPEQKYWETILPESQHLLEEVTFAGHQLIATYLKNAQTELVQYDIYGQKVQVIPLPGLGEASVTYSKENEDDIFFTFTSYTTPKTAFNFNIFTKELTQLNYPKLSFNVGDFETKQVWYPSKDGTLIPMFLIHKKDIVLNGKNPAYLYGYGGFSMNITPAFSPSLIYLLEQGTVIAIANLRGGSEFGEEWHKAGMLMNKQNVFDDFISAAEYLIENEYTSSKKLAIAGGSNGGLLVGACMTQRPDLFQVAFPAVGVMDMLKYQDFTVGWGWVPEYGSSQQSEEMFKYLYGYSPYHNIKKGVNYPATMVMTADHDDRVVPAHSFKYAARLQEYTANKRPALIRIDVQAGHGAGKPISKIIDETTDKWSFFLWNIGVKKLQ